MNRGRQKRGQHSQRHPPGLKGRAIGEFYKRRAAEAKKLETGPNISLAPDTINEVQGILKQCKDTRDSDVCLEFEKHFRSTLTTSFETFLEKSAESFCYLQCDKHLNEVLKSEFEQTKSSDKYKRILEHRLKLPVFEKKEDIIKAIRENQVVLISGDPGCGKTTQVTQILLDYQTETDNGALTNIVCTQPRRIAAITVAERVAWERTEKLGMSVGYQIRLEGVVPRTRGSILYCTTGILLRQMESDPLMSRISHLIIDEVHERTVETDLLLGLLRKVMLYRKDLKIILMSATFCTEKFSNYYDNCPIIHIHGTLFPVETKFLEDVLEATKFTKFPTQRSPRNHGDRHRKMRRKNVPEQETVGVDINVQTSLRNYSSHVITSIQNPSSEEINLELIKNLIFHIHFGEPNGAILVFLPSYDKISKLHTEIKNSKLYQSNKFIVYPLHSMIPTIEQKKIFDPPPDGLRKIILSTNIAETSITIDDVIYVIDAGKIKQTNYDFQQNLQTLDEQWVCRSNSIQRQGRAGRVQPGICYHLYTRCRYLSLEEYPTPEILRCNLSSIILTLKMLRIHNVMSFFLTLVDVPQEEAITNSIKLLKRINALDEREQITPLGLHLARLPVDPQLGKMLFMASIFRCVDPISSVAASISFKDAFYRPLGKETEVDNIKQKFAMSTRSDHLMLANVIEDFRFAVDMRNDRNFCYENFLSYSTLNQLERMKRQFCEILKGTKFLEDCDIQSEKNNVNSLNHKVVRAIICAGLYPNVAQIKSIKIKKNLVKPIVKMVTPEHGRVQFHPSSVNATKRDFDSRFFVYYMKQKSSAVYLFDTTMVHPMGLLLFGDGVRAGTDEMGRDFISVADSFKFMCNKETAELIRSLREGLDCLLQEKALYPSPIDFKNSDECFINAIVHLLTKERRYQGESDDDSD